MTVHPSAFVLNGPRLVVVATLGWRNGPLLSTRSDDDDEEYSIQIAYVEQIVPKFVIVDSVRVSTPHAKFGENSSSNDLYIIDEI